MTVALRAWQKAFAGMLDGGPAPPEEMLAAGAGLAPVTGLAVYRSSSRGAQVRALEAAYPVCRRVVGDDCFAAMAAELVATAPSRGPDLNGYGVGLPALIHRLVRRRPGFDTLPWLADLARLEWGLHRAWHSPDDAPPDLQAVAECDDPGVLVPEVSAALWLVRSRWPVDAIWRAHQEGGEPGPEVLAGAGVCLVVHRDSGMPVFSAVDGASFGALAACVAGRSVAAITAAHGLEGHELAAFFEAGWLIGLRVPAG